MIEKVNFIFYGEWIDYFKEMNDKEIAQTMRAIFETVEGREAENLKGVAAVTYKVIKNQIERDVQKYREKCEKNKENIKKRWQKGNNDIPTEYDRNTTVSQNDTNVIPNNDFGMVKKSNKEKDNDDYRKKIVTINARARARLEELNKEHLRKMAKMIYGDNADKTVDEIFSILIDLCAADDAFADMFATKDDDFINRLVKKFYEGSESISDKHEYVKRTVELAKQVRYLDSEDI